MPRIFVHDYKIEYKDSIDYSNKENFYCGVTLYFNFSGDFSEGDGINSLEYLYISVATPLGLARHLTKCINIHAYPERFFYSSLLIVNDTSESEFIQYLKEHLQSIEGESEEEVLLKALRNFTWEFEQDPEIYDKIFRISK